MRALLDWLGALPSPVIYLLIAAIVFAETGLMVGLLLPGELTLLGAGFLAYSGILNMPITIVVVLLCGLAGDAFAYACAVVAVGLLVAARRHV